MGSTGVLFVFSGPSGVGKGTLKARLLSEFAGQIVDSVSATTRAPREGEQDGREYFFITRQEFMRRVENNEFLEHAEYSGNCYGTPRQVVEQRMAEGAQVILEIDMQGGFQIRQKLPQAHLVFIEPPSMEVLEARLRGRGTETEEAISARLEAARLELSRKMEYDYLLVNDDLDVAAQKLADYVNKMAEGN